MKRNVLSILGALAVAALLLGCSAAAMKATPIWDREYPKAIGPAEDRVNLWPIYYYRNPAWSVLWPLISVSDEGSAVVPLYEYDKTKGELRVLSAHQYLPSGATTAPDYTRVLNVIRDQRGATDEFDVLPLYFQNFKNNSLVLLPVLYKDKDDLWTPLFTKTEHLIGFLGPLFNRYKNGGETFYNFPFPLLGFKTGGDARSFWALPAFYYGREGRVSHLNVGGLLLNVKKDEDSWGMFYAGLLGGAGREAGGDAHNYLVPLWAWWREGKKEGMLSLPYSKYKNGDYELTDALLNGWIEIRDKDSLYQGALWPVFHRFKDAEKSGHAVLPVYWYEKDKAGNTDFHSLAFNYKSDGTLLNVLGPLYYRQVDSDGDQYVAAVWPIAHAWTGKNGDKATALLPLFYEKRAADGGRMLVTPLGGVSKKGDERVLDFGGPLFFGKKNLSTGKSYHAVAWPIFNLWREADGKRAVLLLPAFFLSLRKSAYDFISLPVSFGKNANSHFLNLGVLLFNREVRGDRSSGFMLANLIGWDRSKKSGRNELHAFPLFSFDETPDYRETSVLLSGAYTNKKGEQTLRYEWLDPNLSTKNDTLSYPRSAKLNERHALGFLFSSSEWLRREIEPLAEGAKPAAGAVEVKTSRGGRAQAVVRKDAETRLLPLAWYSKTVEGKGSEACLGWRLYDSLSETRPDGTKYERQRVLWRMFHREKSGDAVAVDMFPFISWDNNPQTQTRRWTFAGGLLGGGKKDGKGYGQIMFVKF